MRSAVPVVTVLLLLLSGCGDPQADYCTSVQKHRTELADMTGSDAGPAALLKSLPLLRDLAAHAPSDLKDEWQTFVAATERLDDALDRAGVRPGEFREGKAPGRVSATDRSRIKAAATHLASSDVYQAVAGIEQQARDVCGINIGL